MVGMEDAVCFDMFDLCRGRTDDDINPYARENSGACGARECHADDRRCVRESLSNPDATVYFDSATCPLKEGPVFDPDFVLSRK